MFLLAKIKHFFEIGRLPMPGSLFDNVRNKMKVRLKPLQVKLNQMHAQ